MNSRFFSYVVGLLFCHHLLGGKEIEEAPYDLTLVGSVSYETLCQYPAIWIENLKDSLNINVVPIGICDLDSVSVDVRRVIEKGCKQAGRVSVLLENVWSIALEPVSQVPKESLIKIAYSTFESTKLPPQWVQLFNEEFDAVVVLDPWWVDLYRSCGVKVPVFVLPAGLELADYLKEPDRVRPHKPFTFGMTGAFWDRKNHQILLRAFEEEFGDSEDVHLLLHGRYGNPRIIDFLVHTVLHHHLPNVTVYRGVLNKQDYMQFMSLLDCYVLVSLGEGYSISPREAMALGIPCILSQNTAHLTLCKSGLVRPVTSDLKVSADREPYGGADVGKMFDCSVADVRKALRDVYEHYNDYLTKARASRSWVKQYTFEALKPLYLTLIKPSKVVLGKENRLEPGCLTTDSEALYKKYQNLIQHSPDAN